MTNRRNRAIAELFDALEIKAVFLRVTGKKLRRDIELLHAISKGILPTDVMPHLRRAIRLRLQALSDTEMGEQEVLASQDFYKLHKRGNAR